MKSLREKREDALSRMGDHQWGDSKMCRNLPSEGLTLEEDLQARAVWLAQHAARVAHLTNLLGS